MDGTFEPDDTIDLDARRFVSEIRDACLTAPLIVEPRLGKLLAHGASPTPVLRRPRRMKSVFVAKIAAAAAAVVAATGGLAVASALPAPVQSAVSHAAEHVGVGVPSPDGSGDGSAADVQGPPPSTSTSTSTTVETDPPTPTTVTTTPDANNGDGADGAAPEPNQPKNHGAEVSAVAHDDSTHGCEHGRAVSSVASGRTKDKPCPSHEADGKDDGGDEATPPSTATVPETTTPAAGADHEDHGGGQGDHGRGHAHQNGGDD